MKSIYKKGGISILGALLLGLVLIIVLSYFNVSIKAIVESPKAKDNFSYIGSTGRSLWNDYLKKPFSNVLNSDTVQYFWKSFLKNMQNIHDGKPTDFQKSAPTLKIN
ncbi:hypothetical protein KKA39_00865 [Patescibacteria group bacterium]|nr:hypothetical protein [Patescibacteria group bacterium]MBU1727845.1 hypothetical protein [Patescibacteria group bacterium]